jgi:hypothetical protein
MESNPNQKDYVQKDLVSYLKEELLSNANKLRGKYPPISEIKEGKQHILKVKKVYQLMEELRNLYVFIVRNYEKTPKKRYFLAHILAGQSSDFLVFLAKDYSLKNNLRLIQYCVHPKSSRVSLLALNELVNPSKIKESIDSLKKFRKLFREKLEKISNLNS